LIKCRDSPLPAADFDRRLRDIGFPLLSARNAEAAKKCRLEYLSASELLLFGKAALGF
jgi:hypothetical protein